MAKEIIQLRNLIKKYEDSLVVDNVSLTINENEFVTFLGPSGCGKTTTLRMIGGFTTPDEGEIILNGKVINDLPPYARPINTIFQKYALFPHLNVFENIAFGLRNKPLKMQIEHFGQEKLEQEARMKYKLKPEEKVSYFKLRSVIKDNIASEVRRILKLVKLDNYEKRKINQMSGGQQQRIAIARALINRPKILLLDEPLAALDLKLRQNMQYELKDMQRKIGITFVFVTHDQEEAMTMSDRIVVMNNGKIVQIGSPKDIYNEPVNRYVANFIGESNIIEGNFLEGNKVKFMNAIFDIQGYKFENNQEVDIVIRPEDFDVIPAEQAKLTGKITSSIFKGVYNELLVMVNGREFIVHSFENVEVGQVIGLKVDPYEIHLMKRA